MDLTNSHSSSSSTDTKPVQSTGIEITGVTGPSSTSLTVVPVPVVPVVSTPVVINTSPGLTITNKIFSKNANGTVVPTSNPSNDAELQLYRVMQRASLLSYYDTLVEMGGDDVQQLCDAGEEEFLEIMALVGMASKPLHVRRFQKALQEWMIDPSAFLVPLNTHQSLIESNITRRLILEANRPTSVVTPYSPSSSPTHSASKSSSSRSNSPLTSSTTTINEAALATLTDVQVEALRCGAERLTTNLLELRPRILPNKRRSCQDLESVMTMAKTEPRRMEIIRKYAAIYGRFDCKRKPEKPLTLHEVSVNEAAAQLCYFVPALLTRRDQLFPLARQLVRDSNIGFVGSCTPNNGKPWNIRKSTEEETEPEDEPVAKKTITDADIKDT